MAVFDAKFVQKKKHTRVVHAIMKLENHYSPQPSTMAAEAIFVPSNAHSQYAHLISQKFDVKRETAPKIKFRFQRVTQCTVTLAFFN